MKTKTTYLSELDAARLENEQLSTWYRDLQEKHIMLGSLFNRAIGHIEKLSGATHVGGLIFERGENHPCEEKRFCLIGDGDII